MVTVDDPKAFGYIVGKVPYQWDLDQLIIAWVEGTVEKEDTHRRNVAFAPPSVYLTNDTAMTLDQGPLTVIRDGTYVGEALLEFTRPEEKKLIAFALEIGVVQRLMLALNFFLSF